ncbi:MAG: phosphoenolpyruvate--protein phosphotransferase [Mariprofundales bacterium]
MSRNQPRCHGHALASSSGVVIGQVQRLIRHHKTSAPIYTIVHESIAQECARFDAARQAAITQVKHDLLALEMVKDSNPSLLLKAHLLLLQDPELISSITFHIKENHYNSHWSIQHAIQIKLEQFNRIDDPYLREMRDQLIHAGDRIISHLMPNNSADIDHTSPQTILIAADIPLPDVVTHWQQGVAGIISMQGGINNHVIVMTRGIGIPALVGLDSEALTNAENGDVIILDGERKQWILHPNADDINYYQQFQSDIADAAALLASFADEPSITNNGITIKLMCNVEFPEELGLAKQVGTDGIGLLRTEFAFLTAREAPTELSQYHFYRRFVRVADDKPVTIRLLDIGADKRLAFHPLGNQHYHEDNPALGLRGIRLLLRAPQLLRTQIRAIIRTATEGKVHLMVPMVTHVEQMVQVREIVAEEMADLDLRPTLLIGAMIEVPAAVMIADELTAVCDFFSIGTNDLIQYTLAADRCNDYVLAEGLALSDHPAIARMISLTAASAKRANIPISLCGELAADPAWSAALIRMGITTLSMSSSQILPIRRHIRQLTVIT